MTMTLMVSVAEYFVLALHRILTCGVPCPSTITPGRASGTIPGYSRLQKNFAGASRTLPPVTSAVAKPSKLKEPRPCVYPDGHSTLISGQATSVSGVGVGCADGVASGVEVTAAVGVVSGVGCRVEVVTGSGVVGLGLG